MMITMLPRIVLIAGTIASVYGIKCWVCRSDADPKCADPFDNKTLPITDCDIVTLPHLTMEPLEIDRPGAPRRPVRATMCRKMRQKVEGVWRTIRGCAFLGMPGEGTGNEHHCLIRIGTHDIYTEYCTCNSKDGCNGSSHVQVSLTTLSIVSSLAIVISRLLLGT